MDVIKKASGFIRSLVARRINLRVTPEFTFILDDSLDYSFKIDKILKDIHKTEEVNAKSEGESENTADEE
jgi:ribosome-binding factor A